MNTTTAANKRVIQRFYEEILNRGNLRLADELVDRDLVEHDNFPGVTQGRAGYKEFVITLRNAFPDLRVKVEDIIAEDDRVAARVTLEGTHRGHFFDLAPTKKKIKLEGYGFARLANNRIVEHWGLADEWHLTQQLGSHPSVPTRTS